MNADTKTPIKFDLTPAHAEAIDKLASGRQVRLSGQMKDGKLVIDNIGFAEHDFTRAVFVPVNAPFMTAQAAAATA